MKYLNMYSYQNSEFPEFRELCQKFAYRYLIHMCSPRGTSEYTGEFKDEIADAMLRKFHNVQELTETYDAENNYKLIPYSVEFERFAINNGNWSDRYAYCEFHDNRK